ncbi:sensor histidine kinase [Luteibaculum oceani]|uniref:histidine kinase n=1 Tax=Luteibaculum oceani TaxID=1294296 RepID=A0A5C6VA83_9FLAO|nr:HAMP domain-containing sensor histidine kinase [Luteibaculum oceani]TXC81694.1 HAMP domain-containing histidine kinase [Luteibaculum oceani]
MKKFVNALSFFKSGPQSADSQRYVVVYNVSLFTVFIGVTHILVGFIVDYPQKLMWFLWELIFSFGIIAILAKKGKAEFAKLAYAINAYLTIIFLTPLIGYESNTYIYLIPAVGMPLIFFEGDAGIKRWILVGIGLPIWFFIEFYAKHIGPWIALDEEVLRLIAQVNTVLTIGTSMFMFYIFSTRLLTQLRKIDEQKERLEKAKERLEQFNYVLTHDLKAPLKNISSTIELLKSDPDYLGNDDARYIMDVLDKKTSGTLGMLLKIIEYFKSIDEKPAEWIDPNKSLDKVLEILEIPEHFEVVKTPLPQVYVADLPFHQVVLNLMTNAIKYNDKEKGKLEIYFEPGNHSGAICFKDNGSGVDENEIGKMFDMYSMFHEMKEGGSGMGLALSQQLLAPYDVFLRVQSEKGEGACFKIVFPLVAIST